MSYVDRAAIALAFTRVLGSTACGSVAAAREVSCGAQPVEVLPNGSFDATPAWMQDPATPNLFCDKSLITPADGTMAACLGNTDGTVQTLTQSVPLPEGARSAKLSGQLCIDTLDTAAAEHDVLSFDLLDGDTVVAALGKATNQMGVHPCAFAAFERTATVTSDPPSVTLRIRATLDTAMPTGFYLDALHLTVGCTQ